MKKKYIVFDPESGKTTKEEYTEGSEVIMNVSIDMSKLDLSGIELINNINDQHDNIINFYVISSSGNGAYCVTFDFTLPEEGLIIECSCPAGTHRQLCKHKLQLIKGDKSIFDPQMEPNGFNETQWATTRQWISECGLDSFVQDFEHRIKLLEVEKNNISKKIKNEKKALARMLSEGFKSQ